MELNLLSTDVQCRICLEIQQSEEMTSLFELIEEHFSLSDILKNISNIEVEAYENIPSNVCSACLTTIVNFHNLLLQFRESEEFLKKTYNEAVNFKESGDSETSNFEHQSVNSGIIQMDIENKLSETIQCYSLQSEMRDSNNIVCASEKGTESSNECKVTNNEDILDNQLNMVSPPNSEIKYKCEMFENNCGNATVSENNVKNKVDLLNYENCVSEIILSESEHEVIIETLKYSCEKCGDSFLIKSGFHQHMLQKHNISLREKGYAKYCSKVIVKQPKIFPELTKAIKPKAELQSQCNICKKDFENASEVKEHMNIHKTHVCPVCGSAFLKKCYLTDHMYVHSSQKQYVCHICNASFKQRHGLTAHRSFHTTLRNYTCEICGHSFKDKAVLKIHIKLKHKEERNFACSECPQTFKLKSFLKKHFIRKHTERTKDFVCSDCGVEYLNKTTLLRHISLKHSGKIANQHVCPVCGNSFSVRLSLNRHLQLVHRISVNK